MSVRVSVAYPASETGRFDLDYYTDSHIPMVQGLLAEHGLRRIEVDRGASRATSAAYAAVAYLEFDSIEAFKAGFAAAGPTMEADIANYTDIEPVVHVFEVVSVRP
jgi:uncharacterized protein (TIGR02118 family)